MNRSVRHTLAFAVLVVCLFGLASGSAVAIDGTSDDGSSPPVTMSGVSSPGVDQADIFGAGSLAVQANDTERHQNPDEYGEDGDSDGVQSWLLDRLSRQLGDSAIELSEGEYDLAREFLGDEYDDRLGQYVEVAGETDGESAEETFEETRDEQERLADLLEAYEETRAEYEAALEAGETERARELARELVALAEELDTVSENLGKLYDEIEELTGADLSEAATAVSETNEATQSESAEIRSAEFTETSLEIEATDETISFLDPLQATGVFLTAEGERIPNETVQLSIADERTLTVETDGDGEFEFTYRPTTLPLETSSLLVEYVPDSQSVYLGGETSMPVTLEQVQPQIVELSAPAELAFAERATVSGDLLVSDVPVNGVEVELSIDGYHLGEATVSEGSFEEQIRLPASVPAGEQRLTVELPGEDRALAGAVETSDVTVRETETELSLDATSSGEEIAVNGTLAAGGGIPVDDAQIKLRVDGASAGTVTVADGEFAETLTVDAAEAGEDIRIQATYDGANSNLVGSAAETVVSVELSGSGDTGQPSSPAETGLDSGGVLIGLVGVFGLISVLALVWWVRNHDASEFPFSKYPPVYEAITALQEVVGAPEAEEPAGTEGSPSTAASDAEKPVVTTSLLEHAQEQLQSDRPAVAVQASYSAVRRDLESRLGITDPLTHWEFYRAYRGTGDGSGAETFRAVTEAYERATFSGEEVSSDSAREAFEQARQLCQGEPLGSAEGVVSGDD